MILVPIIFSILLAPAFADKTNEQAFTELYQNRTWGTDADGEASSGGGSAEHTTKIYRTYLQHFLRLHQIHSVVDIGCGNWSFSHLLDWSGIDYRGYDVVPSLIGKNNQRYASKTIQFFHADAVTTDLPPADLLICKDVLQHLPNADIERLIAQLHKFKYCLFTNDVDPTTRTSHNSDTCRAGYREIDLTKPPFSLPGNKVLTYHSDNNLKQVLLIIRPN